MARDRKDRTVSWFMAQHGGSLLRLAPVGPVQSWHAAQTVLAFPKQIPDGLLEVTFADQPTPAPFLVEIEAYPEQDTIEQIRSDVAMVLLTRGVLPDVLLLVLRPKGNRTLVAEQILQSARGLTELRLTIHVVNLWTVPAETLLATGDVALIPWVTLAQYAGAPEVLLAECRARIEQQARPEEKDNLLVMARVLAEMRYNKAQLLSLLGGPSMTIDKVLLQTPAGQRLIAEKERQLEEKYARKAEETVRKAEEAAARKVEEAARKAEEAAARKVEEAARKAEEAARKVEEAAARKAEEAAARKVEEAARKAEEAAARKVEEAARKAEESGREMIRKGIVRMLQKRFGPVPEEVARSVAAIQALPQLGDLLDLAVMCPDLAAFRQALSPPGEA